jgi:hypothetical protein
MMCGTCVLPGTITTTTTTEIDAASTSKSPAGGIAAGVVGALVLVGIGLLIYRRQSSSDEPIHDKMQVRMSTSNFMTNPAFVKVVGANAHVSADLYDGGDAPATKPAVESGDGIGISACLYDDADVGNTAPESSYETASTQQRELYDAGNAPGAGNNHSSFTGGAYSAVGGDGATYSGIAAAAAAAAEDAYEEMEDAYENMSEEGDLDC